MPCLSPNRRCQSTKSTNIMTELQLHSFAIKLLALCMYNEAVPGPNMSCILSQ